METLARFGYAARGVVYVILGWIALNGAFAGQRGPTTDAVFSTLLTAPFGRFLLGSVALGLAGHVLWRFAQAFLNTDHHDANAKGFVARGANLASGVLNGALAAAAARMALGDASSSGDKTGLASWVMGLPFGPWLVGVGGVAIACAGAVQIWRGLSGQFRKRIKLPSAQGRTLYWICVAGLSARGALFLIIGGFLVFAAVTVDPRNVGSTTEALDWIRTLPFGGWLYAIAAGGLVAFGLYSIAEAFYRNVSVPPTRPKKARVFAS